MIISIADVWDDAKDAHKAYMRGRKQRALARKGKGALESDLLRDLLSSRWEQIAVGAPAVLRSIIGDTEKQLSGLDADDKARFYTEAEKVFDYDQFCAKGSRSWNAFDLCKVSRQKLCPYCHQTHAFTIQRERGGRGFRPTLDHFYAKGEYPFLALSLFNLVPSCQICNSSLKGETDFFLSPHLHPLEDEELIRFVFDLEKYLLFRDAPAAQFSMDIGGFVPNDKAPSVASSIRTFLLDERYAPDFAELARFAQSVIFVKSGDVQSAMRRLDKTVSEQVLLRFDRSAYKAELLGGIKRDIYDALTIGDGSAAWPGM